MKKILFACAIVFSSFCLNATTFYLDANKGNDENDGRSPETAWNSLGQISKSNAQPGDSILFKRGCIWRGRFNLISGAPGKPVTFGNYGEGPLPIIQGSIAQDNPSDWSEWQPGIWATKAPVYGNAVPLPNTDIRTAHWACYIGNGAQAVSTNLGSDNGWVIANLKVLKKGSSETDIQWWGPYFTGFESGLTVKLRARSKRTVKLGAINILQEGAPWTTYARGYITDPITPEWKEYSLHFRKLSPNAPCPVPARLNIHLGSILKEGDEIDFELLSVQTDKLIGGNCFINDIGNIILDHGQKPCARKRWGIDKLERDFDYFHDHERGQVFMKAPANPATLFKSIELAVRNHIINHGSQHDVIVDGLAVRYGASHGFGGGSSKNITIRNCDVYYIGGALQYMKAGNIPVRYGNGIEFWGNCDGNLVENNRIWEIYDAALTNQGRKDSETNVTYRNNVIWNAEYSFEYWNAKVTDNIVFENNTCVDAGHGWAHFHRPNPNGGHMMFYNNSAKTTHFIIRNNIFFNSTEVALRHSNRWLPEMPVFENNLWGSANGKPLVRYGKHKETINGELVEVPSKALTMENFDEFPSMFPNAKGNFAAIPKFVNPEKRDYRLAPDSPGFGKNIGAFQKAN